MLGALLGGLAGILFPAAGAAATGAAATGIGALLSKALIPALGAGLGTLATGGSNKDAIRNALLMGAGTAAFPGAAESIRSSQFGQNISGGISELLGLGPAAGAPAAPAAPAPVPAPPPRAPSAGVGRGAEAPRAFPSLFDIAEEDRRRMEEQNALRFSVPQIPRVVQAPLPINMVRPEGADFIEPAGMSLSEAMADIGPDAVGYGPGRIDPRLYIEPRRRGFAVGGAVEGPGTGTSDSIPAEIYQDGKPVQKAKLSDGEFVMTARAVKGAGNGSRERGISRMYELMRRFESGEMA